MVSDRSQRSLLALAALQGFAPAIRESVISDLAFQHTYGLKVEEHISFNNGQILIQRSKFFSSIREVLINSNSRLVLRDAVGEEWLLEVVQIDNERRLALSQDKRRFILPDFSPISQDQARRIDGFDQIVTNVHLPQQIVGRWREILVARALTDDEMVAFDRDIEETPFRVAAAIRSGIDKGQTSFSTLVPASETYFEHLAGKCESSENITQHSHAGGEEHISQLMSGRGYDGFLLSLLLSSHSSVTGLIKPDQMAEEDLIQAYEWLQNHGDRISQLGAIEVGISILDKLQAIEPYILRMVETIRDDNADDDTSRFHLLSALIVLVESEISRRTILRRKPPFWRRLASIAQASLIERCIIDAQVDIAEFTKRTLQSRVQLFYLQTMADLRREPRWHPDYVSSGQLKAEFVGRIFNAARLNDGKIQSQTLRDLLLGDKPKSLQRLIVVPLTFLPGPLEGGLIAQMHAPAEILTEIEKQLSQDVLDPHSFIALVNSALVFRLELHHAQLAAKALRTAKYHLRRADHEGNLISILRGLATVAAVTRSTELAEEVRILIRRCRHEPGHNLSAEDALWIGLITAASRSEFTAWCDFVGDWVTELAFQSLQPDEMKKLHSHIEKLCHVVPELWRTCARAEAALTTGLAY